MNHFSKLIHLLLVLFPVEEPDWVSHIKVHEWMFSSVYMISSILFSRSSMWHILFYTGHLFYQLLILHWWVFLPWSSLKLPTEVEDWFSLHKFHSWSHIVFFPSTAGDCWFKGFNFPPDNEVCCSLMIILRRHLPCCSNIVEWIWSSCFILALLLSRQVLIRRW